MKARGKRSAAAATTTTAAAAAPTATLTSTPLLSPSTPHPPHLFILPSSPSPAARFLTLPHPTNSAPSRFFLDPSSGFYEFTRLGPPKRARRSLLLTPGLVAEATERGQEEEEGGYVLQNPGLFVATPVDALWVLLPALCTGDEWATLHDRLFGMHDGGYEHLRSILQSQDGRALADKMEGRLREVCEVVDMGEESSHKLSHQKLATYVVKRAAKIVEAGLPKSMEEHFVARVLEKPETTVRREDSGLGAAVADGQESEAPAGAEKAAASPPLPPPSPSQLDRPPADDAPLAHLLRLRTAVTYLKTNYIPSCLHTPLQALLPSHIDFSPLDAHLAHLDQLKSEAQALRSIGDNISRKRHGGLDDDEAIERHEAKKRKKEEEDARKKKVSLGVKKLAKVDTSGMRKMSAFFATAGPKKR